MGSWLLRIGAGGGSGDRDATAAVDVAGALAYLGLSVAERMG